MTEPALVRYRSLILTLLACGLIFDSLWAITFLAWGHWLQAALLSGLFVACLIGYKVVAGYKP